jgi:hypothetical protein
MLVYTPNLAYQRNLPGTSALPLRFLGELIHLNRGSSAGKTLPRLLLWIFCVLAAALTPIALIPGILVPAAFLAGLPAIILILAPYVLVVSAALLIGDLLSSRGLAPKATIATIVVAGVLLALIAAASWFNHQLQPKVEALTQGDHDLREPLAGTRNIAIQFVTIERARSKGEFARQQEQATPGMLPPPTRKQYCERLCLHLLFDGLADSVLVSSASMYEGDHAPPDLSEIGMRFHLERAACRNPATHTDDITAPPYRLFERGAENGFAEEVSARMIAGQCVIGEPARLSEAQIILQENPFILPPHDGSNRPSAKNVMDLELPPARAARLTIYRVQDGQAEEVFRQTQVEAYPLLPVLLLGPVFTGEGGIGIFEGFLRERRFYSDYNLHDVLQLKLGMNVTPISH